MRNLSYSDKPYLPVKEILSHLLRCFQSGAYNKVNTPSIRFQEMSCGAFNSIIVLSKEAPFIQLRIRKKSTSNSMTLILVMET